jgi:hypothetical protein
MAINISYTKQGLVEIAIQTVISATGLQIPNVRLVTGNTSYTMVTHAILNVRMVSTEQDSKATVSLATVLAILVKDLPQVIV